MLAQSSKTIGSCLHLLLAHEQPGKHLKLYQEGMIIIPLQQDRATVTVQTWIYRVAAVSFYWCENRNGKYSNVGCVLGQREGHRTHMNLLNYCSHLCTKLHGHTALLILRGQSNFS